MHTKPYLLALSVLLCGCSTMEESEQLAWKEQHAKIDKVSNLPEHQLPEHTMSVQRYPIYPWNDAKWSKN